MGVREEPGGCAGCGQEPPPLIGAALLPSAGQVSVFEICEGL